MTTNSPSFRSPLLASLRRTGADDAAPRSPALSDDDFLMRRRTPGGAERPAPSPGLFPAGGASTAPHRPSPLGLPPRATTTTTFSSSTTPRSGTGTNFKARLQAMQTRSGGGAATTPPAGGLTRPGSLGWGGGVPAYRPFQRSAATTGTTTAATRPSPATATTAGPAPPGASLADELQQLRLEVDRVSLADTPSKAGPTGGLSNAPATPASAAAASPAPRGLSVHPGARIPTPSGAGVPQWSPMVASGAGRSRGRKAMGAGALTQSRSGAAAAVPPAAALGVELPATMSDALRSRSQSPTKAPRGGGEAGSNAAAAVATDNAGSAVDGLRRRLRAEMPEFGVGEWDPPAAPQAQGPPKSERRAGGGGGGDALATLAALRREADAQLQGGDVSLSSKDDDAVCRGVRTAFREALGTPGAKATPPGVTPKEGGAARRTPPPPKEVEQRLERLRLLREQAAKVAAMPSPGKRV